MKLPALLALFIAFVAICSARATPDIPDSAYANAFLYLTSSNSQEFSSANSTVDSGYAQGFAQPGFTVNSVLVTATSGGSATSFKNEVLTGFYEILTILDPALTGSAGTLDFNYEVDGDEEFAASSPATSAITVSASLAMAGGTDILAFTKDSSGAVVSGSDFLGVPETISVPFIFGTPLDLSLSIDTAAMAEDLTSGGSAMASGSFSTTSSIGDITAAGFTSPLPASSVTIQPATASNVINVSPVPEPRDILLTMGGLAALGLGVYRRRNRLASA